MLRFKPGTVGDQRDRYLCAIHPHQLPEKSEVRKRQPKLNVYWGVGGRHSTKVAFALHTQLSLVQFLAFLKFGFSQQEVNCPYSDNECILFGCFAQVSLPKLLSHFIAQR